MADEHSMDISIQFDFQEVKNSVDQAKREALNRYDLKDAKIEIDLTDDEIKITAMSEMQINAVYDILLKKLAGRNLSPKILDRQKIEEIGGMRVRQELKLKKVLDQEMAKQISKIVRDLFPKAKPVIQGETVRVSSKSIDDLQGIMKSLNNNESIKVPLQYGNYR